MRISRHRSDRNSKRISVQRPLRAAVEPLESRVLLASATVNFTGAALWTDKSGGTHGVPLATVKVMTGTTTLATVQTDVSGSYSGSFSFDPAGGAISVFARIFAQNAAAEVESTA